MNESSQYDTNTSQESLEGKEIDQMINDNDRIGKEEGQWMYAQEIKEEEEDRKGNQKITIGTDMESTEIILTVRMKQYRWRNEVSNNER